MRANDFNLIDEPWIKVIMPDASLRMLSLSETFKEAHKIKALSGELPTQDFAVLRLLLAVLHTVFSRRDENGELSCLENVDLALDRWQTLWEQKCFPVAVIQNYLDSVKEKFWLFDEKEPFFQVPSVKNICGLDSKGKLKAPKSAAKLNGVISESDNKINIFSIKTGDEKNFLNYDEAARWLIHFVGFSDCSIKKSNYFKEKHSGEKEKESPGLAWLAKLGIVYAEGSNLFETLMLNLVLLPDGKDELPGRDIPIWEEKPENRLDIHEREKAILPNNFAELLTYPSRQIVLEREANQVTGYYAVFGKFFDNNLPLEQMTLRKGIQKKDILPFQPRRHMRDQFFWQEFNEVFVEQDGDDSRPGIVKWINRLQSDTDPLVESSEVIHFRSVGIFFDSKNSSVEEITTDTIDLHAGLISKIGKQWLDVIKNLIFFNKETADALGDFAKDIYLAKCGKNPDNKIISSIKADFYSIIDPEFRKWLITISTKDTDFTNKTNIWKKAVKIIAKNIAYEAAQNAGPVAYIGRETNGDGKSTSKSGKYYVSSASAYNKFMKHLYSL